MDQCLQSDIKQSMCNKEIKPPGTKDLDAYIAIKMDSYNLDSIKVVCRMTHFQLGCGIEMGVACETTLNSRVCWLMFQIKYRSDTYDT